MEFNFNIDKNLWKNFEDFEVYQQERINNNILIPDELKSKMLSNVVNKSLNEEDES